MKEFKERRYQTRAKETFADWIKTDNRLATIILPTGCGKTATAALCLDTVPEKKILWVAHREELIDQAFGALDNLTHNRNISVEMAERKASSDSDIVVGSVQTIARNRKHLQEFVPDVIVIDEYHHYSESNVQYDGLLQRFPGAKIMGLTATPWRFSGENLPLGDILIRMDVGTAVEKGYLVQPVPDILMTEVSLAEVKTKMGDFDIKSLSKAVNVDSRNKLIAQRILSLVKDFKRQGILFGVDVEHSKAMYELLKNEVRSAEVYGETPIDERRKIMAKIKNGEIDVLFNNLVACEGFDVPHLSFVMIARPTKSLGLYIQCLDQKTEILTQKGFVGIDAITKEDMVAAMDTSNCEQIISFEKIENIFIRNLADEEEMYELQLPAIDIRITDGHNMIYRKRSARRKNKLNWIIKKSKELYEEKDQYDLPISGFQNRSGVNLSDDEIRFIGWFLTDGTLNKKTKTISITQAVSQPYVTDIEKCLQGCGFKYGKYLVTPKNAFPNAQDQFRFAISHGMPRKTQKHLTGWAKLEPYIDKNFSPLLEDLNIKQLSILLESIHFGDGSKQVNANFVRRSYHISTGNIIFANRLQSLCVRSGYKCNLATHINTNGNDIYILHIKNIQKATVSGRTDIKKNVKAYPALSKSYKIPNERVWCVQNRLGTLITRRNGKVAIVGNCAGRGLRISDNKTDCIIVDVYDKIKARQSRVCFKDMAVAGDLYGERKRSSSILTADVPVEKVANRLLNFPVFIKPEKIDRWQSDEETFSISSWTVGQNQWIVSWTAEIQTQKLRSKAMWVPFDILPSKDIKGRPVRHSKFGEGTIKEILDRGEDPKILVTFDWSTDRVMQMKSLERVGYVQEHVPDEFDTVKKERLYFICMPELEKQGRIIAFEKDGNDLILRQDNKINRFDIDKFLSEQAKIDGILQLVRSDAKWKKHPATLKQIDYVKSLMKTGQIGFDLDINSLTKGEVSSIIEQARWQQIINKKFGADFKNQLLGYDASIEDI